MAAGSTPFGIKAERTKGADNEADPLVDKVDRGGRAAVPAGLALGRRLAGVSGHRRRDIDTWIAGIHTRHKTGDCRLGGTLEGNEEGGKGKQMKTEFKSKVYTDRPLYADFDPPRKFMAIQGIIAKRLIQHPNAICSYSGGSDSDILIHLIETVRSMHPQLSPVRYCFFNTGLEMEAIKRHVHETEALYGVEITKHRPKKNIVLATREYGLPFISKIVSSGLEGVQKKNIPLSIAAEYMAATDKIAKRAELRERYPKSEATINFVCGCNSAGEPRPDIQLVIGSSEYLLDFIMENPIPFKVSNKCCDCCKKQAAHDVQKPYEMIITGERRAEGGMRSVPRKDNTALCFTDTADGKYRLRPLYYVTDADKRWYKDYYGIRYSDAYEVYGLKRTGCCGCSISAKAVEELEKIRPFEPNLVTAAWNVFGDSYIYRQRYNEYKAKKRLENRPLKSQVSLW